MKKLPIICFMSLSIMLLFAAAGWCAQQKRVYLKDGGIIECRSFGRSNGKITVVVNRDVVLEFNSNEVDLKRTFASRVHREKPKHKHKRAAAGSTGAVPDRIPAKPSPVAVKAAPRQGKISSSVKTASAAPKQTGSGAAVVSPPPKPMATAAVSPPPVRPALKFVSPSAAPAAIPTAAILAGMLGAGTLLPLLLLLLLMLASLWKVFVKAGEAGWKGLIPIYNIFLLIQIAGKPWWWFLLLFIPGVNLIIWVLINIALAERFGKGALFGLGLFFFGIIFFPVLAFGKAEYN
jgi:hypothetical protein